MTCAAITVPAIGLMYFASDTPTWLMQKGEIKKATEILINLHGPTHYISVLTVIEQSLARSAPKIPIKKHSLLETDVENNIVSNLTRRSHYCNPVVIKSSAVALGIMSFQQLTGKHFLLC